MVLLPTKTGSKPLQTMRLVAVRIGRIPPLYTTRGHMQLPFGYPLPMRSGRHCPKTVMRGRTIPRSAPPPLPVPNGPGFLLSHRWEIQWPKLPSMRYSPGPVQTGRGSGARAPGSPWFPPLKKGDWEGAGPGSARRARASTWGQASAAPRRTRRSQPEGWQAMPCRRPELRPPGRSGWATRCTKMCPSPSWVWAASAPPTMSSS